MLGHRYGVRLWMMVGLFLALGLLLTPVLARMAAAEEGAAESASGPQSEEADWDWSELGPATFARVCAACHGEAGEGGFGPTFIGNEFVMGEDAKVVIRVPMNGRGAMPSFRDMLSDEELAAVLSYIRNSWGNEADAVLPAMVAEVRAEEEDD